jgi:hypothetical protein
MCHVIDHQLKKKSCLCFLRIDVLLDSVIRIICVLFDDLFYVIHSFLTSRLVEMSQTTSSSHSFFFGSHSITSSMPTRTTYISIAVVTLAYFMGNVEYTGLSSMKRWWIDHATSLFFYLVLIMFPIIYSPFSCDAVGMAFS